MPERPRYLRAEKAHAMSLDPRLQGLACPRQAVDRYARTDTQRHARGWRDTHTLWALFLTGTKPLAWRKFSHLPMVIITEIMIKTIHGGWISCQRK